MEAVLIWTFVEREGRATPDFRGRIRSALEQAGVDTGATIEVAGKQRPRIVIETFGRETATNAHRHCTNVIIAACLEIPRQTLAAQYVAESRDLGVVLSDSDLDLISRGEVYHRLYQAVSRAACRETWVDEDGRSQARPVKVWLRTRHHQVEQELGRMFPGATWQTWHPHRAEDTVKEDVAARRIRAILATVKTDLITIRALKATDPALKALPKTTFQRARNKAIEGSDWMVVKGSLVRKRPADPGGSEEAA